MQTDSAHRMDDGRALHLTTIMKTASTPATPGPSTPVRSTPLEPSKPDDIYEDIIPPARPKSTPFPQQELNDGNIHCTHRFNDLDRSNDPTLELFAAQSPAPNSPLVNLPIEIHECILDHLFGVRASASSRTTAGKTQTLRSWSTALRHSRRREVSQLALVSKQWRTLIQDRLYRHLKIKGTRDSIGQAMSWFHSYSYLQSHVKHIEIWFPVFQQRKSISDRPPTLRFPPTTTEDSIAARSLAIEGGNMTTYETPSDNCTVEEIFYFVRDTFAQACILTLEGGDRKKPPQVKHLLTSTTTGLPVIDTIQTLVCKGQWNLVRSDADFRRIALALPNLKEWHGSYAKPKSKSYLSMATILPKLPRTLTHLNICLEADYRREGMTPPFAKKVALKTHICIEMAKAIPTLEHLAYTGRVCREFFIHAAKLSQPRDSRLKSIDLIVKNCCRPTFVWNDGSGITDMQFILAFEQLVIAGIKSLKKLAALELLRIRFIDLGIFPMLIPALRRVLNGYPDSQVPALNPYFLLNKTQVTGLWSDEIIEELEKARPAATFVEKPENLEEIGIKDGQLLSAPTFSKTRPLSIRVSSYAAFSSGININ